MAASNHGSIHLLTEWSHELWWLSIILFGFGDIVTTSVGLTTGWVIEVGPLAAFALTELGLAVLLPLKVLVFVCCYSLWMFTPNPYRIGVPLGLVGLGLCVTVWNIAVLVIAGSGSVM